MILTWEQLERDIYDYYEKRADVVVTPKAVKMFLSKFRSKIKPQFKSPMEILSIINEEKFCKRIYGVGKQTEEALTFIREKYSKILMDEKKEEEKEERFLAYKAKLDKEYGELKEKLEAQYNPKFKLKELYAFIQSLETCGIDGEHTDVEVDLMLLEQFRKTVTIKLLGGRVS